MQPDLTTFRWIVVNSSGGKDSQVALHAVIQECDRQGVDRAKVVVSHQDLGQMEWDGTKDLVYQQAAHYGLRVEVSKYRNKEGKELSLLDYVRKRGKWPSNKQRYCTSDFKRAPGSRVITKLFRESPGDIINVFGFRAQESPARAKKKEWVKNPRLSIKGRDVWDWLPIHEMKEDEVWRIIHESGVPFHPAYTKGMPRLSCRFCIFAPRAALIISGRENPELLREYVTVEKEIGHTFQNGQSLEEIQTAIAAGEQPSKISGAWNM